MAAPKSTKHKEYARYAAHCLNVAAAAKNEDFRSINREMAAEWLKLADAALHPLKRTQ
jgi:RecB family exonuclease